MSPVAAAATLAQGLWCPIHETNSHDLKNCRTIYDLAENRKKRHMDRINAGTTGNCFSCG
jgi:hypothetical protein